MVDPSLLAECATEPGRYKAQASFEIAEHYRVRGRICRDSWNSVISTAGTTRSHVMPHPVVETEVWPRIRDDGLPQGSDIRRRDLPACLTPSDFSNWMGKKRLKAVACHEAVGSD